MCTFLFWMEHCGIWSRCILGFVKLVCSGDKTILQLFYFHNRISFSGKHYSNGIMGVMASQITSLKIVYSNADQRKHQSSASLAFVRGIHWWLVNSPHKGPVTWKMFPFDHIILRLHLNQGPSYNNGTVNANWQSDILSGRILIHNNICWHFKNSYSKHNTIDSSENILDVLFSFTITKTEVTLWKKRKPLGRGGHCNNKGTLLLTRWVDGTPTTEVTPVTIW